MRTVFINPSIHSTGDCKLAKGHRTRGLYFDNISEARDLLKRLREDFPKIDSAEPFLVFKTRKTRRKNGHANYFTGEILMYPNGQRVSTLLHEYAHLMPGGRNHGKGFKANQDKLLRWWEAKVEKAPKVDLVSTPTKTIRPIDTNTLANSVQIQGIRKRHQKPEYKIDKYVTASGFHTTRWSLV